MRIVSFRHNMHKISKLIFLKKKKKKKKKQTKKKTKKKTNNIMNLSSAELAQRAVMGMVEFSKQSMELLPN